MVKSALIKATGASLFERTAISKKPEQTIISDLTQLEKDDEISRYQLSDGDSSVIVI